MEIRIDPTGTIHCIYDEAIDLSRMGTLCITRASHVEPDNLGHWWADLSPLAGPRLGPFPNRSAALSAEINWLQNHYLFSANPQRRPL